MIKLTHLRDYERGRVVVADHFCGKPRIARQLSDVFDRHEDEHSAAMRLPHSSDLARTFEFDWLALLIVSKPACAVELGGALDCVQTVNRLVRVAARTGLLQ